MSESAISRTSARPRNIQTCEECVVGVGFEGEDAIGNVGEGVGEEPNICNDVHSNPAVRHQFGKDREFGLARACFLRDALPVEDRWRQQHRESFAQG